MIKPIQIILLTHEREVGRPTNTGQLALQAYPEYCQRVVWSRVHPDVSLVRLLENGQAALLFPDIEDTQALKVSLDELDDYQRGVSDEALPDVIVILDATWQEARKMCRRSEYLKKAMKYALPTSSMVDNPSQFTLRRNQVEGGFCTVECIQQLFSLNQMHEEAAALMQKFKDFNQRL